MIAAGDLTFWVIPGVMGLHLLLWALCWLLRRMRLLRVSVPAMWLAVFLPFVGEVMLLMISTAAGSRRVDLNQDLVQKLHPNQEQKLISGIQPGDRDHIVPLEDALLMEDTNVGKDAIASALMQDGGDYITVLSRARGSRDREVARYASAAVKGISRELEYKLQKISGEYERHPEDELLLDEYIGFLEQYLAGHAQDDQLVVIQRSTYQKLLVKKIRKHPTRELYAKLIGSYLDAGQFFHADAELSRMERQWRGQEEVWLLRYRYYYELKDGKRMQEMIREKKESGAYLTGGIRDVISFWENETA